MELLEILEKNQIAREVFKNPEINEFLLSIYMNLKKGIQLGGNTFTLKTTEKELVLTWLKDSKVINKWDLSYAIVVSQVYRESFEKILEKDKEVMAFFKIINRSPEEITIQLK